MHSSARSSCRSASIAALAFASSLAAQQAPQPSPAAPVEVFGRVTGHVLCADTGKPARFAGVQLVSEQSMQTPVFDAAAMAASVRGNAQKAPDFGSLLTTGLSAVMKGSGLSDMTTLDGGFSLDKVPPGAYYVITQLAGYVSPLSQFSQRERMKASAETIKAIEGTARKIVVGPNQTVSVDLQLERGATIGGVVRYQDGAPAAGVIPVLMALQPDGKWKELPPAAATPSGTDDRGRYRFAGVPAGQYAIKAPLPTSQVIMGIGAGGMSMQMHMGDALDIYSSAALRPTDIKPVKLTAGEERDDVDLVFPITGLHTVSGTVRARADGHAVNSGMVAMQDPEEKTRLRQTMIARDGTFRFNYVPDGAYLLAVSSASDMEGGGSDAGNPLALLMNAKNMKALKEYGAVSQPLSLPGNSENLVLEVPDRAAKTPRQK